MSREAALWRSCWKHSVLWIALWIALCMVCGVASVAVADDKPGDRKADARKPAKRAKKPAKRAKKPAKRAKKPAKRAKKPMKRATKRTPPPRRPAKRAAKGKAPAARPGARRVVPARPVARPARPATPRPRPPKTKAEKIVEKMVVAIGGRQAWGHVRTTKAKGITQLTTVMGSRTAKLTAYEIRPGYQRIDLAFQGQNVVQSHHPKGGWISQNGAIFQLPRAMSEMTKAEAARSNLELRYATEKILVKHLRTRTIRGQSCEVIVFVDAKGNRTTYYISTKTSLLVKRSYMGPSPLGTGKKRFTTYQSDFRWVRLGKGKGKVMMPFRIENYIGGRKIGVIQLKQIKINDKSITKKTFHRPSPVE